MATNNGTGGPYDYGREMADEQLREMQERLSRLYTQAGEDITRRLDTFLERFDQKDQLMRERVAAGAISEDEYLLWRQNKILRAAQMEGQMNSLANDLVNVDRIAVDMINGELPDVYCAAYNFEGFRGETMAQMSGYNYNSFSMYNAEAVRIITTEDPDLIPWKEPSVDIPKDLRWNRRHIQDAITQGILAGDDMRQLSARLLPLVNMDENAAMRTARTSYVGVQNQARRDATARIQAAGIPMEETWVSVLQANTRDTHLMLHGTHPNEEGLFGEGILPRGHLLRFPGDPNGQPEQIYNCQCGVTSRIRGIDHSDLAARSAQFMQENYYDDWVGRKVDSQGEEFYVTGVSNYRLEETRAALERRRRLVEGEIVPREARRYLREQGVEINADEYFRYVGRDINGRGGVTLSMQDRARQIANMTDEEIWREFYKAESYAKEADFQEMMREYTAAADERSRIIEEDCRLTQELKAERRPKPREEWDMMDEIGAMVGDRPMTYTERGQEINSILKANSARACELDERLEELGERYERISSRHARAEIEAWQAVEHPFTRASVNDTFYGFSTSMRSSYDNDLANGIGFIASMSPDEYLDRMAYDIFGTTVEHATFGIEYGNIREYAQMMADGTCFDMGYLDYNISGTGQFGQEGRHRAMAARLLGIDRIPVYIRGRS